MNISNKKIKTTKIKYAAISMVITMILGGCASPSPQMNLKKSYLQVNNGELVVDEALITGQTEQINEEEKQKFRFVPQFKVGTSEARTATDIISTFSEEENIVLAADGLPLSDYLHHVLGEQLKTNYILSEEVEADKKLVTFNIQSTISPRKLFTLTEELLTEREYVIRYDDGIFYIHQAKGKNNKTDVVYGYGNSVADVPQTSLNIIQMVPLKYGMQASLPNTMKLLLNIKSTPDISRNSITVNGKRKDIVRAIEFINMMDTPLMSGRAIGAYSVEYANTTELVKKLTELLKQEGISLATGSTTSTALTVVQLDRQGELVFFAKEQSIIDRAVFWANQIDKPVLTAEKQYFIYQPQFSRAVDMGESLEALISGGTSLGNSTSAESQNNQSRGVTAASSKDMRMVVDERSNSLIFHTSGANYQQILPLIKRLDILPKQVILEVMIAEVKLTDKFKSGVDMVLTNSGASKVGGFNLATGSTGLSYVLSGTQGSLTVNLLKTNTNVNVLSRPSLLVRDGVTATISVGDDIPTVGEVISDPTNGNKTSVVYRKTGIDLKVKPTINARGVIIMEINQNISNSSPADDSVAGSPIVFERKIGTEVIAESGETIILGGLISENKTYNDTSVPFFSSIPLVGELFKSNDDSEDRTELVVLVTPKIIESQDEWNDIRTKFMSELKQLNLH